MSLPKLALLTALLIVNVAFVAAWIRRAREHPTRERPTVGDVLIGFGTDFLDALGIGSFAPTTAIYKLRGSPADELIPGTLNVGHNAAAFTETLIFTTVVAVEPVLLATMVASATMGAWLGAGVVGPAAAARDPDLHGSCIAHRRGVFRDGKPGRFSCRGAAPWRSAAGGSRSPLPSTSRSGRC
jgi:hypothetical protein